ncbi:MAG: hypothetical protein R3C46_03940 [Hyphomonadaceae bacterium]
MAETKSHEAHLPAKVTDATFEPVSGPQSGPLSGPDPFWDSDPPLSGKPRPPLSFSGRMFNVGWKGWTRLALVCVTVGAIFQAGGFNPFAPDFTIGAGLGQIVNGVINVAAFVAQMAALPLLLGALAVLPLWIGWRALVTLFNRDKPPGPDDRILPKERRKKVHKL